MPFIEAKRVIKQGEDQHDGKIQPVKFQNLGAHFAQVSDEHQSHQDDELNQQPTQQTTDETGFCGVF